MLANTAVPLRATCCSLEHCLKDLLRLLTPSAPKLLSVWQLDGCIGVCVCVSEHIPFTIQEYMVQVGTVDKGVAERKSTHVSDLVACVAVT